MERFIPYRFFGFDSFIYIFAAIIGFVISAQLLKLYRISSEKSHLRLHLGLVILSTGFLILGIINTGAYINFIESCRTACQISVFNEMFDLYDLGYWMYYALSLVAYIIILTVYLPEKSQFPAMLSLLWPIGFKTFHLLSLLILSYVIFRTITNYFSDKNRYKFLIMIAFLMLGGYHLLLFFVSFNRIVYAVANLSLLASFMSFMLMMLQVKRK